MAFCLGPACCRENEQRRRRRIARPLSIDIKTDSRNGLCAPCRAAIPTLLIWRCNAILAQAPHADGTIAAKETQLNLGLKRGVTTKTQRHKGLAVQPPDLCVSVSLW